MLDILVYLFILGMLVWPLYLASPYLNFFKFKSHSFTKKRPK